MKKQIVCFGELLIDMISLNPGNLVESRGFLKKFGGAPANTASGLAKLGLPVSYIGKVGQDPFGQFLKKELESYGVNTSRLVLSPAGTTTLALVSLTKAGERDFFFIRGVHDKVEANEVSLPKNTDWFHFGSLTQTTVPASKATDKLVQQAIKLGAVISYDPNIREFLWGDLTRARLVVRDTMKKVDIFKVNEEEAEILSGCQNIRSAAEKLFRDNLDILVITLADKGCYYKTRNFSGMMPTIKVKVVDTTGAGDAFNAGLIAGLYQAKQKAGEMRKETLEQILKRAVVIGSLTTTRKGAVDAFPSLSMIKDYC